VFRHRAGGSHGRRCATVAPGSRRLTVSRHSQRMPTRRGRACAGPRTCAGPDSPHTRAGRVSPHTPAGLFRLIRAPPARKIAPPPSLEPSARRCVSYARPKVRSIVNRPRNGGSPASRPTCASAGGRDANRACPGGTFEAGARGERPREGGMPIERARGERLRRGPGSAPLREGGMPIERARGRFEAGGPEASVARGRDAIRACRGRTFDAGGQRRAPRGSRTPASYPGISEPAAPSRASVGWATGRT
jgi:hypothetical protein